MLLELEMPHPDMEGMKLKGRVYVCDLAGTEPAGDVVYATYKKWVVYKNTSSIDGSHSYLLWFTILSCRLDDGEMKFTGPHPDKKKTKELQDQGKKINLSLTEMGMFFKKMAELVKKKKLKPGKTIPGCNSYFLCKYLKEWVSQKQKLMISGLSN